MNVSLAKARANKYICCLEGEIFTDKTDWFNHCNAHYGDKMSKKNKATKERPSDIVADHAAEEQQPEPPPAEELAPSADGKGLHDLSIDELHNAMVNLCEPVDFGSLDSFKVKGKAESFLQKCIAAGKFSLEDVLVNTGNKPVGRIKRANQTGAAIRKIPGVVRTTLNPALKMHILITPNPRRAGTGRHARYESYKEGMTVEEWIKLGVGTPQELKWDAEHDLILELK